MAEKLNNLTIYARNLDEPKADNMLMTLLNDETTLFLQYLLFTVTELHSINCLISTNKATLPRTTASFYLQYCLSIPT